MGWKRNKDREWGKRMVKIMQRDDRQRGVSKYSPSPGWKSRRRVYRLLGRLLLRLLKWWGFFFPVPRNGASFTERHPSANLTHPFDDPGYSFLSRMELTDVFHCHNISFIYFSNKTYSLSYDGVIGELPQHCKMQDGVEWRDLLDEGWVMISEATNSYRVDIFLSFQRIESGSRGPSRRERAEVYCTHNIITTTKVTRVVKSTFGRLACNKPTLLIWSS